MLCTAKLYVINIISVHMLRCRADGMQKLLSSSVNTSSWPVAVFANPPPE